MKHTAYDYIVLGATIPGIIFAAKKSRAGHTVLLTNMFGFPGGSITEQLNCYQKADAAQLTGTAQEIYRTTYPSNFERSIINPESLKIILQQILERTTVDLYYHVVPKMIAISGTGLLEVSLLAKEGITTVAGKKVIDASEDHYGAVLLGRKRTVKERNVNIFISRPADDAFLSFKKIRKAVVLSDGRYWLSLRIDSQDELFAENETHELLDALRIVLEDSKSRIQVLPLGSQTVFSLDTAAEQDGRFAAVDDILGASLGPSELFRAGSLIEIAQDKF